MTFVATAGGGDGNYSYVWTINEVVDASCTTASCVINPADTDTCARNTISVAVDDGSPLCAGQAAGPKIYKKITTGSVE